MSRIMEMTPEDVTEGKLVMIDAWAEGGEGLTEEPLRIKKVDWPVIRIQRFPPVPITERDLFLRLLDAAGNARVTLREIEEGMLSGQMLAADDITGQ